MENLWYIHIKDNVAAQQAKIAPECILRIFNFRVWALTAKLYFPFN